jgi:hypothetical protein
MVAFAAALGAQQLGEPFFLMRFTRGDSTAIRPYRQSSAPADVIAMDALTGSTQTWLIEPHGSFAGVEALDQVLAQAPAVEATRWIGVYRSALSYRSDEAIKLVRSARYYQVTVFRMRPGADVDFAEMMRMRKAAFDSINLDRPEIGYQVISGSTTGTYIFLAPLNSLRTLDNTFARMPTNAEVAPSARNPKSREIQWEADITREHMLFRVDPRSSWVSEAFSTADPDFWRKQ